MMPSVGTQRNLAPRIVRSARAFVVSDAIHPLLFGAFPALSLLAQNIGQVQPQAALRSLVVSLFAAALLLFLLERLYGDRARGATAATLILVVFFSYGHVYDALKQFGLSGVTVVRHRFLLPLFAGALIIGFLALRKLKSTSGMPLTLNVVALALLVQPMLRLSADAWDWLAHSPSGSKPDQSCILSSPTDMPPPDIYLIVMDAYARHDVLRDLHRYDNESFLGSLETTGFYVVRGSLSNYAYTEPSLASMLNLNYVQDLAGAPTSYSAYRSKLIGLIQESRVRKELECIGYYTVALSTGVFWTEWDDADFFLTMDAGPLADLQLLGGLSRLELLLIRTTMLRAGLDILTKLTTDLDFPVADPNREHRERILFAFDQVQQIPKLPSPKLVFVHILSPHPPMVFGPMGEFVSQAQFETNPTANEGGRLLLGAYADQVNYLNSRLEQAMAAIIEESAAPPIIVIQGDHGWADREPADRLAILNALYLPDQRAAGLYPTMSPVNTFRYIFDAYFGANLELLEDVSYFSARESVYSFVPVQNTWTADG